ncbi:hypothetical protein TSOC_014659 [Tetrabaena socialis]|uniref:Uncharacterized protein n=1 Tax=Tetrabaena socialis TaxID=47790 RepID=A0A2J7ZH51_9CHLO|nr:hypothetical protein TSOC_014659 [Tetrabaena socialis]|eukprot:PNG99559.1 hypothetical protein TSOC_014659 [Tetrabaena socialis]
MAGAGEKLAELRTAYDRSRAFLAELEASMQQRTCTPPALHRVGPAGDSLPSLPMPIRPASRGLARFLGLGKAASRMPPRMEYAGDASESDDDDDDDDDLPALPVRSSRPSVVNIQFGSSAEEELSLGPLQRTTSFTQTRPHLSITRSSSMRSMAPPPSLRGSPGGGVPQVPGPPRPTAAWPQPGQQPDAAAVATTRQRRTALIPTSAHRCGSLDSAASPPFRTALDPADPAAADAFAPLARSSSFRQHSSSAVGSPAVPPQPKPAPAHLPALRPSSLPTAQMYLSDPQAWAATVGPSATSRPGTPAAAAAAAAMGSGISARAMLSSSSQRVLSLSGDGSGAWRRASGPHPCTPSRGSCSFTITEDAAEGGAAE